MINILVAQSLNGVIGHDNEMLWKIPEELALFKRRTLNSVVIMGRKTYDSLPIQPLPDRFNLVLTRNVAEYNLFNSTIHNPTYTSNLQFSILYGMHTIVYDEYDNINIIGGEQIYQQAIKENYIDRIYQTIIPIEVEGNKKFPPIDPTKFKIIDIENHSEKFIVKIFERIQRN